MSTKLSLLTIIVFMAQIISAKPLIMPESNAASSDYSSYPVYEKDDLGLIWSRASLKIKVWSPVAESVVWRLYDADLEGEAIQTIELRKGTRGTWQGTIPGNWLGKYYTVQAKIDGVLRLEVPDPYAVAVGRNGKRGHIIDVLATNPEGWEEDRAPAMNGFEDVVLYEVHVRDLTSSATSGAANRGTFKGFAETGTKSPEGISTGLDHIASLGVTHVHLLPVADYASLDETLEDPGFNWGYEPLHYNVPEGTYSSNAADGAVRMREFKELVKACHEKGIRVVLDVVYNHTTFAEGVPFEELVPGYWYRQNEDGSRSDASGCGNETATERAMVQKYIRESLKYWVKEYHVDGFRFDLMGIHDIEGMQLIRQDMNAMDPNIILYGEGWTAGASPFAGESRALKANMQQLEGIAAFSDDLRDALKGPWHNDTEFGFVSGKKGLSMGIRAGMVGGISHPQVDYSQLDYSKEPWVNSPLQTINYVSCHDNHTLFDKLLSTNSDTTQNARLAMHRLANTVVVLSQGIPFFHAGVEFGRTKQGDHNSYKSADSINAIDWSRATKFKGLVNYHRQLLSLRAAHPAFRLNDAELVREVISFKDSDNESLVQVRYDGKLAGDSWSEIMVILNGASEGVNIEPEGNWLLVSDGRKIYNVPSKTVTEVFVKGHSAVILAKQ